MGENSFQEILHTLGNRLTALAGKVRKAKKQFATEEQIATVDRANELIDECVQLCIELRRLEQGRKESH